MIAVSKIAKQWHNCNGSLRHDHAADYYLLVIDSGYDVHELALCGECTKKLFDELTKVCAPKEENNAK